MSKKHIIAGSGSKFFIHTLFSSDICQELAIYTYLHFPNEIYVFIRLHHPSTSRKTLCIIGVDFAACFGKFCRIIASSSNIFSMIFSSSSFSDEHSLLCCSINLHLHSHSDCKKMATEGVQLLIFLAYLSHAHTRPL